MKFEHLAIALLVIAGVVIITALAVILAMLASSQTFYYNGVYDSCMVVLQNVNRAAYTEQTYPLAVDYCERLTESAKEADAFHNRINLAPKDTIDA